MLIAFIEGTFVRNMIIILWIDYNSAVINDNPWKSARPHFALLNSPGHAIGFIQNYTQLGHAPSKVRQAVAVLDPPPIAQATVPRSVIAEDRVQS